MEWRIFANLGSLPNTDKRLRERPERDIHILLPSPNVMFMYKGRKSLEGYARKVPEKSAAPDWHVWRRIDMNGIKFQDRPERDLYKFHKVLLEKAHTEPRILEVINFVNELTPESFQELCFQIKKEHWETPKSGGDDNLIQECDITVLQRGTNKVVLKKRSHSISIPPGAAKPHELAKLTKRTYERLQEAKQDFFVGGYSEFLVKWYTMYICPIEIKADSVFKQQACEKKEVSRFKSVTRSGLAHFGRRISDMPFAFAGVF